MKKFLFTIFALIFTYSVFAQIPDKCKVEQIALKYIDSKLAKNDNSQFQIKSIKYQDFNNHKSYYIVDFHPTGHILMSAYKYYEPILSYSLEDNYKHLKTLIL